MPKRNRDWDRIESLMADLADIDHHSNRGSVDPDQAFAEAKTAIIQWVVNEAKRDGRKLYFALDDRDDVSQLPRKYRPRRDR